MAGVTQLIAHLEALGIQLDIDTEGRLVTSAPRGAITADLADVIGTNRELIVAVVIGRRTGHAFGPCTTCAEESMVNLNRTTWPACRMTPGCKGRHQPGQVRDASRDNPTHRRPQ